jgi:hypothetical protein
MSHTSLNDKEFDEIYNNTKNMPTATEEDVKDKIKEFNKLNVSNEQAKKFLKMLSDSYLELLVEQKFLLDENTNKISISEVQPANTNAPNKLNKDDVDATLADTLSKHGPALKASTPPDSGQTDTSSPFVIYGQIGSEKGTIALSEADFKKLQTEGIEVEVPETKVSYNFKIDKNQNPEASIDELPVDDNELMLTVMNIIENIVSHSKMVVIETNDAKAAGIAEAYMEAIKEEKLDISYEFKPTINPTKYKGNIKVETSADWFKAAENLCSSAPTYTR